jgi:C-terminal processing protease CtpA/Prc
LCCLSPGRADEGTYGALDFTHMTKDQEQFFWDRLEGLAFEEALLTYCGQSDDFETRAQAAIQSCVTKDALQKADAFFRAKLRAGQRQIAERKFTCKGKPAVVSRHGWLGVEVEPVGRGTAAGSAKAAAGALVVRPLADSPAAAAGVEAGDIITAIDGAGIADPKDLVRRISLHAPQTTAKLDILRNGAQQSISVKLGMIGTDAEGRVSIDGQTLLTGSKTDLDKVATEVGEMCAKCKSSIWAVFCK